MSRQTIDVVLIDHYETGYYNRVREISSDSTYRTYHRIFVSNFSGVSTTIEEFLIGLGEILLLSLTGSREIMPPGFEDIADIFPEEDHFNKSELFGKLFALALYMEPELAPYSSFEMPVELQQEIRDYIMNLMKGSQAIRFEVQGGSQLS